MTTTIFQTTKDINGAIAVQLTDYKKQTKLAKALEEGDLTVTVDFVAELKVEDETGERAGFSSYVFVTTDNKHYVCSSANVYRKVVEKLVTSNNEPVTVTFAKRTSTKDESKTYFTLV